MSEAGTARRSVVITGAGRGLGRAYALAFGAAGFGVVVNDLGVSLDGAQRTATPADEVVEEIRQAGGHAVADFSDISAPEGAEALVARAIAEFGALHTLVNNAGIVRDRALVNMSVEDFDDVVRVHLRGTFLTTRAAAQHWREAHSADRVLEPRLVNTTSTSGLYGNFGQGNYSAAKAGIAAFTLVCAMELARYGVLANAIAPGAATRMTEAVEARLAASDGSRDPADLAPLVVWLGSPRNTAVTGTTFLARGHTLDIARPWSGGAPIDLGRRWTPEDLDAHVPEMVREAAARA